MSSYTLGALPDESHPSSRYEKWSAKKFLLCFMYYIDAAEIMTFMSGYAKHCHN